MPRGNGRSQYDDVLHKRLVEDADRDTRRCGAAKVLATCQRKQIKRLEGMSESGRSAMSRDKAMRMYAEVQALVAIEQMKEIHRARLQRVVEGGTP